MQYLIIIINLLPHIDIHYIQYVLESAKQGSQNHVIKFLDNKLLEMQ